MQSRTSFDLSVLHLQKRQGTVVSTRSARLRQHTNGLSLLLALLFAVQLLQQDDLYRFDNRITFAEAIMFLSSRAPRAIRKFPRSLSSSTCCSWMGTVASLQPQRAVQVVQRRSFGFQKSYIQMMPEGPEVRALVDQLRNGGIGQRVLGLHIVAGRYVKNGPPEGYEAWRSTLTPQSQLPLPMAAGGALTRNGDKSLEEEAVTRAEPATAVDIIEDWNCKGKFMYLVLDNGGSFTTAISSRSSNVDFKRSIWITLGMSGKFLSEKAVQELDALQKPSHVRWYLELLNVTDANAATSLGPTSRKSTKVYYADSRGFGTLKFSTSRQALIDKLESLGPDMLSPTTTESDFLSVLAAQRNPATKNVCKFLMDQSNVCGIGNYILAEGLYRANVDPFCTLAELNVTTQQVLFRELQAVIRESYQSLTTSSGRSASTTTDDADCIGGGTDSSSTDPSEEHQPFEYQCYGQERCKRRGSVVHKETNGPHGRTIWYTDEQLFMPRRDRQSTSIMEPGNKGSSDDEYKSAMSIATPGVTRSTTRISPKYPASSTAMVADQPKPRIEANLATALTPGNAKLASILSSPTKDYLAPTTNKPIVPMPSNPKPRTNLATRSTPGNAKLASLLASVPPEPSQSTVGMFQENRVSASTPADVSTDEEAPLLVEEFVEDTAFRSESFVRPRGSSTAAFAQTPGNAKLAAILASKGAATAVAAAAGTPRLSNPTVENDIPKPPDPGPLMAKLLSGLTDPGWKDKLTEALVHSPSFASLALFLEDERNRGETIYPPTKEIFAALNLCPLDSVKVVIVGQDPYHGAGQGHGLAFSVRRGVRAPPSLVNIIAEVIEDVGIDEPRYGNLECWARQGVLLLNSVLTVREGNAFSHANKGWENVTDAIIRVVSEHHQRPQGCGLVFLLWGNAAANKVGLLVDAHGHKTIQTSHPSPLGATKTKSPFLGSRCFSATNKLLMEMGHDPINWSVE